MDIKPILYQYASEGWHLFPVNKDKQPYETGGFHKATQTQSGINEFMRRYPGSNWAGWFPRQFIIDIDVKRVDGFQSLKLIEAHLNNQLPETRTHRSASGGQHRIYRQPKGYDIPKADPISKDYPGVDLQANGCYIVLPPSRTEAGAYEVVDESPIIDAPDWIVQFAIVCKEEKSKIGNHAFDSQVEFIPQGEQDMWLYSRASSYRRWGDSEDVIFQKLKIDLLRCKDQDPRRPYTDKDIFRIAHSSARYSPEENQSNPIKYGIVTSGKL